MKKMFYFENSTSNNNLPFNADHVTQIGWAEGKRYFGYDPRINTFKYKNFFRKLMGKPLLKPKRGGWWEPARVGVYFNSTTYPKNYYFRSNQEAHDAFYKLRDAINATN